MNGERQSKVQRWPYLANQKREDAIFHFTEIERSALQSLDAAKRRGDTAEALRQAELLSHARGGRIELVEARYLGRQ